MLVSKSRSNTDKRLEQNENKSQNLKNNLFVLVKKSSRRSADNVPAFMCADRVQAFSGVAAEL